jgi:CRISPR-associated endonuclease Cas1
MAASATVSQLVGPRNSLASSAKLSWTAIEPRFGVLTLAGYGIRVAVNRGHLTVEDGVGASRRFGRFSKIEKRLQRLVVIGSDGFISLAALQWLADRDAAFIMLDRRGSVTAVSGPVRPSDARLRRAQALAHSTDAALDIARELIRHKLVGQEEVVRHRIGDEDAANQIAKTRDDQIRATSIDEIRRYEALGAQIYWAAWRKLQVRFPEKALLRLPKHWHIFGARKSPLTGSPRVAVNPANAMLNYLYALLEAESTLALSAMGLDPGLGVLHTDTPARESLSCDVMEAARPLVDAYVFDWIASGPLKSDWFFETRSGNCRLMADFTEQLSQTASMWARAVAPHAEMIAKRFWSRARTFSVQRIPTRLTESSRREGRRFSREQSVPETPRFPKLCRTCGAERKKGLTNCESCATSVARENLLVAAQIGRSVTHSPKAQARRSVTQLKQSAGLRNWNPDSLPKWLDEKVYRDRVQPMLARIQVSQIAKAISVSKPYATSIRRGNRLPHPRHWLNLAILTGVTKLGSLAQVTTALTPGGISASRKLPVHYY